MSRRAVFVPEGETGPFRARETQIELNGHFCGLRTAFPQVVNEGGENLAVSRKTGAIRDRIARLFERFLKNHHRRDI